MLQCPKCHSENIVPRATSESGKTRFWCRSCDHRTVKPIGIEQITDNVVDAKEVQQKLKKVKKASTWVITSAQNATPVHKGFLDTLKKYCELNEAELIIIPYRYKNPTSIFTDKDHDWWDPTLSPYLVNQRYELCKGLTLLGDIQIQPTAKNPLSGLEGFTGANSCIVGHPKYAFKTVATRQGSQAKLMTTTGAVTLPNYTKSKAGKAGYHHHTWAATVVEFDGDQFYIRQVSARRDGSFTDLDKDYSPEGVEKAPRAASLVLGDLHQWWLSPEVDKATFGEGGLIDLLNPERVFIHDSVDGFSISHHHRHDPFIQYAKHRFGYGSIRKELEDFAEFMKARMKEGVQYVIVPSNHDDHITRYIKETDWRRDPENAEFYLEMALHMIRQTQMVEGGSHTPKPFAMWVKENLPGVVVLGRDESFEILGVEHAMHGDQGPNGSRGSTKALSGVGVKVTSGHQHSPAVIDAAYTVGTSTGKMSYASGPSGWLNSHVVLYQDGKRTMIHVINGKFRK